MINNTSTLFLQGISVKPDSPKTGFPFSIPAIANLNLRIKKHVTFLVGENGSGKSTILEALADKIGFSAMGGTKHHRFIEDGKGTKIPTFNCYALTPSKISGFIG